MLRNSTSHRLFAAVKRTWIPTGPMRFEESNRRISQYTESAPREALGSKFEMRIRRSHPKHKQRHEFRRNNNRLLIEGRRMSTALPKPSVATELQTESRSRRYEQFISRLLTTDFCPQLNRYVYWLKEPIGWFALAAVASLLVGAFLSPIGWTLAAGLTALILAGLALPWIAVRFSECRLEPINEEFSEMESNQLLLTVRNRLPIPLWGLMIKGYLQRPLNSTVLSATPRLITTSNLMSAWPACLHCVKQPFDYRFAQSIEGFILSKFRSLLVHFPSASGLPIAKFSR